MSKMLSTLNSRWWPPPSWILKTCHSLLFDRSSPNLVETLWLWFITLLLHWKCIVANSQMTCGFRWNFTYIPFAMSGLSVSTFTSAILIAILICGWTRNELCTWQCCYQHRWLRHPQKQTQQRWICFQSWFTTFDLNQVYHFFTKKSSTLCDVVR